MVAKDNLFEVQEAKCFVLHCSTSKVMCKGQGKTRMLTNVSAKVITSWVNANSYTGIVDMF